MNELIRIDCPYNLLLPLQHGRLDMSIGQYYICLIELERIMSNEFSKAALLEFLEYLAKKGLANPGTITARKVAANN